MNYHIFAMVFTMVIITAFTTLTINALGQTSDSTLQEGQIFNKTENQLQQFEQQQDQGLDREIIINKTENQQQQFEQQQDQGLDREIKISSIEFELLLDEIKGSINLIQDKKYDAATSKLGLAIIEILNATQQYQELVQFASSQFVEKIQQQQFNDEEKK